MKYRRLAAHIHSDFSDDCDWPLIKIVRRLRWMGYDGAMVCEHDRTMTDEKWQLIVRTCEQISATGFLIVPGIEYQDPSHTIHLPVYGEIPFLGSSPAVPELLSHARSHGAVSVFAHPARRSAHDHFDPAWFADLTAIEVWNRKYDGVRPNTWALRTAAENNLMQFTALDFHGPRQLFPLSVRVRASAGDTAGGVVAAIFSGASMPGAIGTSPDRLADGLAGRALAGMEARRAALAPVIRRWESLLTGHRGMS
ncbi:hypothetical protein FOE78_00495 [Microlunatus elymi]|uniref:PHP domain-containing protein n=1 Tax=Microlunatus elymi TaxID=2596828 RepID=A0A516PTV8_9ACTN|nr:PHP domain-containing protein [Microlunatus elymi]QDP94593.1 hypothetical protein FOE78_00495 [Microlunatus elymi]